MSLERYGWNAFFESQLPGPAGTEPGRVRLATARRAQVYSSDGTVDVGLPRNVGTAAVGDWLLFYRASRIAARILRPRGVLARNRPGHASRRQVLASNVDAVLVVAGLDRPVSDRLIERYLVCVRESGAKAVIVLNKTDLCADAGAAADRCAAAHPACQVVAASAATGEGLGDVERLLPPAGTTALAGPSGVGKSSVVNALLRTERLQVGAVRNRDRRGKHTTTRRELVEHPAGWLLMDIPGIREIYPWSSLEAVDQVFSEISELAKDCLYRDCRHRGEPGCLVRPALDSGRIAPERLASYLELRGEQEELARSIDAARK